MKSSNRTQILNNTKVQLILPYLPYLSYPFSCEWIVYIIKLSVTSGCGCKRKGVKQL